MASARLILRPGKPDEKVYELEDGEHCIGRTPDNDVVVMHRSLSRSHARIALRSGEATIEDLGSRNGTYVDGVRIDERTLGRVHYIKCGEVLFSFVHDSFVHDVAEQAAAPVGLAPTLLTAGGRLRGHTLPELVGAGPTALNLRAEQPGERLREKLQILLEVSRLLSSPRPLDQLLHEVLDLLFTIIDVDRAAVLLPMGDELVAHALKTRGDIPDGGTIHSRHAVRYVFQRRQAALFASALDDPRLAGSGSVMMQAIAGCMGAPMISGDRLIGVLYVDKLRRPQASRPFASEDLEFLGAFASQAALACDNAQLSERLADEAVARSNLLRFFPPTTVDTLARSGGELPIVEAQASVLFADISGFTEMSAQMAPREVIELLNSYFPSMAGIVFEHEGTLEKYIGDALLAIWGVPLPRVDHADAAIRAAVEMQRAVAHSSPPWKRALRIHVGITTGLVAAGNVGSKDYVQYATIGDTTNMASRVCDVARAGEILVDGATRRRLGAEWTFEALGQVTLRGKSEALELYRVRW